MTDGRKWNYSKLVKYNFSQHVAGVPLVPIQTSQPEVEQFTRPVRKCRKPVWFKDYVM